MQVHYQQCNLVSVKKNWSLYSHSISSLCSSCCNYHSRLSLLIPPPSSFYLYPPWLSLFPFILIRSVLSHYLNSANPSRDGRNPSFSWNSIALSRSVGSLISYRTSLPGLSLSRVSVLLGLFLSLCLILFNLSAFLLFFLFYLCCLVFTPAIISSLPSFIHLLFSYIFCAFSICLSVLHVPYCVSVCVLFGVHFIPPTKKKHRYTDRLCAYIYYILYHTHTYTFTYTYTLTHLPPQSLPLSVANMWTTDSDLRIRSTRPQLTLAWLSGAEVETSESHIGNAEWRT